MASIEWPTELPQYFNLQGYQETMVDNVIRDPYEVGPAGLRRRCTQNIYKVAGIMVMTTEEWELLIEFLRDGILDREWAFGFPNQSFPGASPDWLVMLDEPPARTALGGGLYSVNMMLTVLPVS